MHVDPAKHQGHKEPQFTMWIYNRSKECLPIMINKSHALTSVWGPSSTHFHVLSTWVYKNAHEQNMNHKELP